MGVEVRKRLAHRGLGDVQLFGRGGDGAPRVHDGEEDLEVAHAEHDNIPLWISENDMTVLYRVEMVESRHRL